MSKREITAELIKIIVSSDEPSQILNIHPEQVDELLKKVGQHVAIKIDSDNVEGELIHEK